jgi:hypothetical protein
VLGADEQLERELACLLGRERTRRGPDLARVVDHHHRDELAEHVTAGPVDLALLDERVHVAVQICEAHRVASRSSSRS